MHRRFGIATLSQPAFAGESDPNFPWEKSKYDNAVVIFNREGGVNKRSTYVTRTTKVVTAQA